MVWILNGIWNTEDWPFEVQTERATILSKTIWNPVLKWFGLQPTLWKLEHLKSDFQKHVFLDFTSPLHTGVDFINFLRPIRALRPTFEKLFIGVRRALRRALSFDRAISMICALRPTFMKSTPEHQIWSTVNYIIIKQQYHVVWIPLG